jgi:hypothetical protein
MTRGGCFLSRIEHFLGWDCFPLTKIPLRICYVSKERRNRGFMRKRSAVSLLLFLGGCLTIAFCGQVSEEVLQIRGMIAKKG